MTRKRAEDGGGTALTDGRALGQVHHGSATAAAAARRAVQHSHEGLRALAKRYGINQKGEMEEADLGGRSADGTERTGLDGPLVRGGGGHLPFRRYKLLPLGDCLYDLQLTIRHLTRSSLHRCVQRHGAGHLPDAEGDRPATFKTYPIGYFHIDIAEVRTDQGKLDMFVAIDRTSKFAFVELHEKTTTAISRDFLLRLTTTAPYKIHIVLTDSDIQFTALGAGASAVPLIRQAMANG